MKVKKHVKRRVFNAALNCSEKSYNPLFISEDLLENLLFLNFNVNWLFFVTVANVMLVCTYTYVMAFDMDAFFNKYLIAVQLACETLILVDIISMIMHMLNAPISSRRPYEPNRKYLLFFDVLSIPFMIPLHLIFVNTFYVYIQFSFSIFKSYRIVKYIYLSSITGGQLTTLKMIGNYTILCGTLLHLSACILKAICMDCRNFEHDQKNWYGERPMQIYFNSTKNVSPSYIYFIGIYTIIGIFSRVGYTGAAPGNIYEGLFVSLLSILAMFIISGTFLSTFVTVRITNQKMQSEFFSRLVIIKNNLDRDAISPKLKGVVLNYYNFFWEKEQGIKQSCLFNSLPTSIRQQVTLDKYWLALEQSYIFRHETEDFRREVSYYMYSEIMIKGETIYELGEKKNAMAYIAKGSVQLLSRHDGESPILTLGAGSLLGEFTLLYSHRCKVVVRAESYCVIYYLNKSDFWKMASIKYNRERTRGVHNNWNRKFNMAKDSIDRLRKQEHHICFLADVKKKLMSKKEMRLSQERYGLQTVLNYDEVFAKTTWPWILHPRSQVIMIWDMCLLILIIINAIILPYTLIVMDEDDVGGQLMTMLLPITSFFYILDPICKMFAAVEDGDVLRINIREIIAFRIAEFVYLLDIIAALPLYLNTGKYWNLNMLLKVGQVVRFLMNVEKSLIFNVIVVRVIKYVVFIMYTTYLCAVLFIWIPCLSMSTKDCITKSWISIGEYDEWQSKGILITALSHVMLVLSQTDSRLIASLLDMAVTTVISIIGVVLFLYIFSEFIVSMLLNEKLKEWYMDLVYDIEKYMQANDTAKVIRQRMRSFLESQWLINKGLKNLELYKHLPEDLYKALQLDKYLSLCVTMPLFQDIDKNLLQSLVQYCHPIFLPPNEIIVHEGDYANNIFVIEKGYCQVLSVEKSSEIIGVHAYFGEIEMLLDQPARHAVRTLTHVSLVSISKKRFLEFLNVYPEIRSNIMNVINELKASILVHRVFSDKSSLDISHLQYQHNNTRSWYIFPKQKRDPIAKDYENVMAKNSFVKFVRLLLMRRTFTPDGEFIVRWEVFRGIIAVISAILGPSIFVYLSISKHIYTICYFFDVIYVVDMYIRLHGCFYNNRGLLVTHPLKTAKRYLTGSFLIDLISTMPLVNVVASYQNIKVLCILHFFKLFQLYRLPGALYIIKRDSLKRTSLLEGCLLFLPLCVAFVNTAACTHMVLLNDFYIDKEGYLVLTKKDEHDEDYMLSVIHKYCVSLYQIMTNTYTLGLLMSVNDRLELFLLYTSCILIGYLMISYAVMYLINHQANISLNLTAIQNNTKSLMKYMKREGISQQLRRDTMQYFELCWHRSNHMIQEEVLKRCHSGLTQDWVLSMYGTSLSKVPVFYEMGNTFYKMLGSHMTTNNFLGGATIIKLNDIIDTVYIVHRGFVRIIGPDGELCDQLEEGSMFGNIDDVSKSRSMLTVFTTRPVDLICIEGAKMYTLFKNYPVILNRLNKHIIIDCLSYISSNENRKYNKKDMRNLDLVAVEYKTWNIDLIYKMTTSYYLKVFLMLCSFMSAVLVLTIIAFNVPIVPYSYALDGIHLLKFILTLFAPYINNEGEAIKQKKLIVRRYTRTVGFYFEIFAIFPIELFGYLLTSANRKNYMHILLINRVLRVFNVYQYFSKAYDSLDVNMLRMKIATVLLYTFLLVHITACVLYYFSCPRKINCTNDTWMHYNNRGAYSWKFNGEFYAKYGNTVSGCSSVDYYYTCSILYAVSLVTMSGYPFPRPPKIVHMDSLVVTVVLITDRIIIATLLGHLVGLLRHRTHEVMSFNHSTDELNKYLKQSEISPFLMNRVMKYVNQLWMWGKGVQIPTLIKDAPPYLIEPIKMAAYGHHLEENLIFQFCHPDFLRQVIRQLNVENFFAGDMICQQGNLNETMYFVHKGIVDVIRTENNIETVVDDLTELDSFGMYQGLYSGIAHTHSYQSKSVTVVLTLKRSDWFHLLRFYPASQFIIYETLNDIS